MLLPVLTFSGTTSSSIGTVSGEDAFGEEAGSATGVVVVVVVVGATGVGDGEEVI